MKKRCLSLLLVLALCLAYLPVQVHAMAGVANSTDDFWSFADGDELYLGNDISDPSYHMTLSGISGSGTFTIDLNGHDLTLMSIEIPTGSLRIISSTSGGTLTVDNLDHLPGSVTASNLTLAGGVTLVVNSDFYWESDISTVLTDGSTLDFKGSANLGYNDEDSVKFEMDNDSMVIFEDSNQIYTNVAAAAPYLATYLSSVLPEQFTATVYDLNRLQITATVYGTYTDTAFPGPIGFNGANTYTKAAFSTAPEYAYRPYNGSAQELITAETEQGTIYYTMDGGLSWTPTVPTQTDAGATTDSCGYVIVGSTYLNSDAVVDADFGITPLDVAVTVTGHTDTATYDGTSKTVTGYEVTSSSTLFDIAYEPYTYTGPDLTITQTNSGVYPMGLNDTYFASSNTNFSPTFTVTDGGLVIEQRDVTVTADDQSIKVGTLMPAFTATVDGAVAGEEDLITYTVTTTATDTDTEGTYPITPEGTASQGNYNVSFVAGTLTIAALPQAAWTTEPAAIGGLTYNGEEQILLSAGTVNEVCTALYSLDGVTFGTALPAGTNAGDYEVYYKVQGDGTNFSDSDVTGSINISIDKAFATVTASDVEVTAGEEAPALDDTFCTVEGVFGTDVLGTIAVEYRDGDDNPVLAADVDTSAAGPTYHIVPTVTGINDNYYVILYNGTLTVTGGSGGGGGGSTQPESSSYDFEPPEEGVGSGVEGEEFWTWGERASLDKDTATLYKILANNAVSAEEDKPLPYPGLGTEYFLASDEVWKLPDVNPNGKEHKVISVQVCEDHAPLYLANGDGKLDESSFGKSDFYTVGVGTGDLTINYPVLTTGDVVSNKTFNGVFVTKLQKTGNATFDADMDRLKSDTFASFRAFELDHPEVFWLTGDLKLRSMTVTINGVQTAYLFMVLVDDTGFTMRISDYSAPGAIEAAIAQRDVAVAAIIAQIPAGATTREKIANLNKWFTLHNEYNRSADLDSIGFTPHRALKSLLGGEGVNGPVCDGYSRGFKTVCDRLGIPVILDTGVASMGAHTEYHMWMRIQVDGVWYGMDCTWDDPVMEGVNGIVSGYENEKYMLVGDDTVVDGQKFGISHPVNKTAGGTTGVLFASLMVNAGEIDGYLPLQFEDVRLADWFYDYVKSAVDLGLMGGVADHVFSPQTSATRGQIVQILYNAAGKPAVDEVKVDGWFGKAATWAMEKGIVAGYPDGDFHGNDPVTREQLATILWAFEGAPEQSGELSFADADKVSSYAVNAMLWAKKEGLIGGKPGNLADPQGTATRAEIATIFSNYMK